MTNNRLLQNHIGAPRWPAGTARSQAALRVSIAPREHLPMCALRYSASTRYPRAGLTGRQTALRQRDWDDGCLFRVGCRRPSCVVERPVTARLLTFAHPRSTAPWVRSNGRQDRLLPTGATGSSTIGEAAVDDVGPCHSRGCRTHRRHRRDPNKIALSPGWKMARQPTVKLTTFTVTRKRRLQKP